jgi:osmotically-inducible protein OsmY
MASSNFSRNERYGMPGRERYESFGRERDFRRMRGEFPDWDRYGSYRDQGRADYAPGDRETWQTDDLGYGEFGYNDAGYRRSSRDYYNDRDRGFARQNYGYGYQGYDDDRSNGRQRDFMDRASDEVASWFGDEDAERRRRMDQFRGKGPKGYVRTDERIREDVNDRLSDDPLLDASDIEVVVASGEVTLNGLVSSRQDKRRAEDLAEAVSGVTHLQNNLRVKPNESTANIVS